jgi:hypothetical protein
VKKSPLALFLLPIALASIAYAQSTTPTAYPTMAPVASYLIENRQDEIALARSAAPPSVSSDATVLVLSTRGYETAAKGTNGFVCFVERSWTAPFNDPEFWNPKERAPNCFNTNAVRSVLAQYVERTQWALAGLSKEQIIEKARAAFSDHHFTDPEAGSFSFMLSKQAYVNDDAGGPWLPHVMLFVPHGQASAWAAGVDGSPIFGTDGAPYEPTVLFIPVRRWSDGSPAPPAQPLHQH